MEKFLSYCSDFGVQNLANRNNVIKTSVTENCNETVLFLACGYDFIFNPDDQKFQGLMDLFIDPDGKYPLNISRDCTAKVRAMTQTPHVAVSYEGPGPGGSSGVGVELSGAGAGRGGLKAGGVANFNLQTKALEYVVTATPDGLNNQNTLLVLARQMREASSNPKEWRRSHQQVYEEMKRDVRDYWKDDAARVGL